MITLSARVQEGAVFRRVRITTTSIERAMRIAGEGKPRKEVSLDFPIDPEAFFATEGATERIEHLTGWRPLAAAAEAAVA